MEIPTHAASRGKKPARGSAADSGGWSRKKKREATDPLRPLHVKTARFWRGSICCPKVEWCSALAIPWKPLAFELIPVREASWSWRSIGLSLMGSEKRKPEVFNQQTHEKRNHKHICGDFPKGWSPLSKTRPTRHMSHIFRGPL